MGKLPGQRWGGGWGGSADWQVMPSGNAKGGTLPESYLNF